MRSKAGNDRREEISPVHVRKLAIADIEAKGTPRGIRTITRSKREVSYRRSFSKSFSFARADLVVEEMYFQADVIEKGAVLYLGIHLTPSFLMLLLKPLTVAPTADESGWYRLRFFITSKHYNDLVLTIFFLAQLHRNYTEAVIQIKKKQLYFG